MKDTGIISSAFCYESRNPFLVEKVNQVLRADHWSTICSFDGQFHIVRVCFARPYSQIIFRLFTAIVQEIEINHEILFQSFESLKQSLNRIKS